MLLLIFLIIFLIVPIVANVKITFEKQINTLYLQLKIFFIIKLASVKIDINNKEIKISGFKEKVIKFEELKISKPKNPWIVKALRGLTSKISIDINVIEYTMHIKAISAFYAIIYMSEFGIKNFFLKSKTRFNINNYATKISMYLSIYTSIFLIIKEWIKYLLNKKQGVKNASSKLYPKSN